MVWNLILTFFTLLAVISWIKIRRNQGIIEFIYYWGFPFGAFVWEDLFVFSLYGIITSLATILTGQGKIGLLFFLVFWIVRSAGEALYFFLQQFLEPKHFPHAINNHFRALHFMFGRLSYQQSLIFMQVIFQVVCMFSILSLILLLLSWSSL